MLLEFRTKNFKSFVDDTKFSMTAAPKQSGLDYSLLKEKVKGKLVKGLCSSVIYGPNAAGKSNIISAMDVFRSIVLRGNIRNSEETTLPNPASASLELIPNSKKSIPEPVEFSITFLENGLKIRYDISIDLGLFLDDGYKRRIISEELFVNGDSVFRREEGLNFNKLSVIKEYLSDSIEQNGIDATEIAENSLNKEELFLVNGFKVIFSPSFAKIITDWFTNKFIVVYRADSMQLVKRFADPKKKTIYIEKTIHEAARLFGINSNAIGYACKDDEPEAKLNSLIRNAEGTKTAIMDAELFESYGTIRFINMFPLVILAMHTGGTLVVDEFDASIHPMALMSIINIFHNDDINLHHAQLIFNTHNPIFLNSNLFRRDEVKFVERDEESHNSTLYSLSDFGTTGKNGVRKHEDYMQNYFISQYGAIRHIDFAPLIAQILTAEGKV